MTTAAAGLPVALDLSRPMSRRVLSLAIPVLAQQSLIWLVAQSDRYLAGRITAETGEQHAALQAAQTSANYVGWFVSSYTVLVSVGATAVVARCIGAADRRGAIRATHQALVLGLFVGLCASGFGLGLVSLLVDALQLTGESAAYAVSYLRPMFWLLPFQVLEAAGVACLVGAGDTRTGLFIQTGVAVVNLPLAWVLCFGINGWPGLGFVGIAWGTAISYVLGAAAVVAVLAVGRAGLRLHPRGFAPDAAMIGRLLRVSVPAALDSMSVVVGQFWFLRIVNRLGPTAAAAHGTALGWEAMAFQSAYAFGTAAMTLIGQNLGARRPDQAARAGWTAFGIGCAATCLAGVVFFIFAPQMARVFNPSPEQTPIVEAAVPLLHLIALVTPALACTIIFTQALRGAGDTRVPVLFTWFGFLVVRIPLAYLLTGEAFNLGLLGAWLAMCADLIVRGLFFLGRFAGGRWKLARV
jgi:putative MATE family efflux protein